MLSVFVAAMFQGTRGLYETTEGRYAECAREMLISNNFLEPTLDFQPHWAKPPMTYWAIAAGIAFLGQNAWGARAYLIIAFCLTVATVYFIGIRLWGRDVAPYGALAYMTSFFPVAAANAVSADTLLTLWVALSISGFWAGIRTQRRRYFVSMWFFLGAAFFTKGPPGLVPLLWILPMCGLIRWKGGGFRSIFSFTGIFLFIPIAFGWYLWEAWLHPGLLSHWVKHEIAGHLITNEFARNIRWYKAILIYWPVLGLGSLPWVGVLLWKWKVLPWPRGNWFRFDFWKNRIEWSFIALSIILPLVLFFLSRSKLPLYILPLFISISLALGKGLHWLVSNLALKLIVFKGITFITLVIIVAGKMVAAGIPSSKNMEPLAQKIMLEVAPFSQRRVYLAGDDLLYGLEFYLSTVFIRVSLSEPAPVPAITLRAFLERLSRDLSTRVVPFMLVRDRDLPNLQYVLDRIKVEEQGGNKTPEMEMSDSERGYVKRLDNHWMLVCWRGGDQLLLHQ